MLKHLTSFPKSIRPFSHETTLMKTNKVVPYQEAILLSQMFSKSYFNESIEVNCVLALDTKFPLHKIRGTMVLPHSNGKVAKVAVFAKGDKIKEAKDAGAEFVGTDDLVDKITKGLITFDRCLAVPDCMAYVGRVARILGPRGLMPNPKLGTVTNDIAATISTIKKGSIRYQVNKNGNMLFHIGKVDSSPKVLEENFLACINTLLSTMPENVTGNYFRRLVIKCGQGPAFWVDTTDPTFGGSNEEN